MRIQAGRQAGRRAGGRAGRQQTVIMCGFFRIYTMVYIRNDGMIKNQLFKCRNIFMSLICLYETSALNI
jgi:hypothetical protein